MAAKLEIQAIGALYLDIRTLLPLLPLCIIRLHNRGDLPFNLHATGLPTV